MTDFTSEFWSLFIAVLTIVSVVGCGWFLWSQSIARQAKVETTGHTWDEDLAEWNNPLPRWWSWLFYLTIAFGLGYLVLYPGLGSWKGTLGWTQAGQFKDETKVAEKTFGPIYEKYAATDVEALAKNPDALGIGQKLFLNNCAQCHASDGGGSRGYPNLTDLEWLWGGTPEAIKTSITEGRMGMMPAWGQALGEQKVKDVANYVRSLSGLAHDSIRAARGKEAFDVNCVACHGATAQGNAAMGAPNLTDNVWLHGSSEELVIQTITKGRVDQMPAHKDKLTAAQIHLLTAYVYSLSRTAPTAPHQK
jgi:cytochrome c oxidase cbb3-type subunit 3